MAHQCWINYLWCFTFSVFGPVKASIIWLRKLLHCCKTRSSIITFCRTGISQQKKVFFFLSMSCYWVMCHYSLVHLTEGGVPKFWTAVENHKEVMSMVFRPRPYFASFSNWVVAAKKETLEQPTRRQFFCVSCLVRAADCVFNSTSWGGQEERSSLK